MFVSRAGRSIRTDRRFQVFGPEPDAKVQSQFISIVTLLLWKANDVLLLVAEVTLFVHSQSKNTSKFNI